MKKMLRFGRCGAKAAEPDTNESSGFFNVTLGELTKASSLGKETKKPTVLLIRRDQKQSSGDVVERWPGFHGVVDCSNSDQVLCLCRSGEVADCPAPPTETQRDRKTRTTKHPPDPD